MLNMVTFRYQAENELGNINSGRNMIEVCVNRKQ